jgi:hypothetical protein
MFPHTHQKISGDEFVFGFEALNDESDIFSFLSAVFSQDLGCDHLENFNKAQQELPAFIFIAQAFLHTLLQFSVESADENTVFYVFTAPQLSSECILKDSPLRAPPRI